MKNLINKCFSISHRQAAWIAGFSLLLMAVIAPIADFMGIQALIVKDDAVKTFENVANSGSTIVLSIAALLFVVLLDFVIAWAAYVYFRPVNKMLSAISGWIRTIYGFIFAYAIFGLFNVPALLNGSDSLTNAKHGSLMLEEFKNFYDIWQFGLILFGIHLIVLGVLSLKSNLILKIIGVFLVIAGLGYIIDSIGILFIDEYNLRLAMYTFFGEMFLMIWFIVDGFRKPKSLEAEVS